MTDLTTLSIAEAASEIAGKTLSPVELTEAYLARIEAFNPALNAYLTVTADRAREDAERAESEIALGNYLGPLHGVPIGLKDIIDTAGIRTTSGSKIYVQNVPATDAAVAEKLKAAGSILLGKLNTHEFALGGTNINPHYGPAHNPWDLSRITGGSSGGSGAATTAALAAGTIGTDTGGSIRIPAALCGCVGMKPTHGRVSKRGVWPISQILDHVGPMTRTVEDNAIMLGAIAGYDPSDPYTVRIPVDDYLAALKSGVNGLKVGVPAGLFADNPVPEVAAAFSKAKEVLESLGAVVVASEPTVSLEEIYAAIFDIVGPDSHFVHKDHNVADLGEDVRQSFFDRPSATAADYLAAVGAGERIRADFRVALEDVDLLLTPTVAITAMPIDAETVEIDGRTWDRLSVVNLTAPQDLAQLPALTVPCGFGSDGLPIGLTFTGKPFDEALLYRAGYAYEQAAGWVDMRPDDMLYKA